MTAPDQSAVSPKAEKALRDAMNRLFTGRPVRTDGKLTKQNLWREADVSRATMNRATAVLAEWDNHVNQSTASEHDQKQTEEIALLRRRLNDNRTERQQLQDQVDAAATVIAVLLAENSAFREQLAKRSATVIPLGRSHAARE
ncbi:hypothetical protein [uncultured Streptomyces sp.]|uniref:hypothetical protein n=1 Tax=uncultured Streptomyces sp. TaxID=174707 RepID=UPI0026024ABD|nr:hypothetical protein [uncultured Streptomyces sp.]